MYCNIFCANWGLVHLAFSAYDVGIMLKHVKTIMGNWVNLKIFFIISFFHLPTACIFFLLYSLYSCGESTHLEIYFPLTSFSYSFLFYLNFSYNFLSTYYYKIFSWKTRMFEYFRVWARMWILHLISPEMSTTFSEN